MLVVDQERELSNGELTTATPRQGEKPTASHHQTRHSHTEDGARHTRKAGIAYIARLGHIQCQWESLRSVREMLTRGGGDCKDEIVGRADSVWDTNVSGNGLAAVNPKREGSEPIRRRASAECGTCRIGRNQRRSARQVERNGRRGARRCVQNERI